MSLNETTCSTTEFNNPGCVQVMTDYCGDDTQGGDSFQDKWIGDEITSKCRKYVALNQGNQANYVPVVDAMARKYLITDQNPITYPQQGSQIYDPFVETVIDVCQSYPGGCDNVLDQACSGVVRDDLRSNYNQGKLCGCFMPDLQYDSYQGAFGVSKICDPACTLQSAVKPRDPQNQFVTLSCDQTVCVIDDIKINLLNNTTAGNVTFAQACGSCGTGGGCTCYISDVSVTATESNIGDINFEQNCGGTPNCYQTIGGVPTLVDCSVLEGDDQTDSGGTSFISENALLIIIVATILLLVFLIVIYFVVRSRKSDVILRV